MIPHSGILDSVESKVLVPTEGRVPQRKTIIPEMNFWLGHLGLLGTLDESAKAPGYTRWLSSDSLWSPLPRQLLCLHQLESFSDASDTESWLMESSKIKL